MESGVTDGRFQALGLEYAVINDYLQGIFTFEQMVERMQTNIRQYAKRQLTWFKKEKGVSWFDITSPRVFHQVEKQVASWYDLGRRKGL